MWRRVSEMKSTVWVFKKVMNDIGGDCLMMVAFCGACKVFEEMV